MTSNMSIVALSRLITESPDLATALQAAASPAEAIEILVKAGSENGVAVDKAALTAHFAEQAASAKLSDADLDQVAGGSAQGVFYSFLTVGIGCIVVSIKAAQAQGDCGKALT